MNYCLFLRVSKKYCAVMTVPLQPPAKCPSFEREQRKQQINLQFDFKMLFSNSCAIISV